MILCTAPDCIDGIDVTRPDLQYCDDCGGLADLDHDRGEGMLTAAVCLIAMSQFARAFVVAADFIRSLLPVAADQEPIKDKHPTVYVPLGCGIQTSFAGMTEPCARRHGHNGRCMSDAEIEHIAEHGAASVVEPCSAPSAVAAELRRSISELAQHVDTRPPGLFSVERPGGEVDWVTKTVLMVEALDNGESFTDETRA